MAKQIREVAEGIEVTDRYFTLDPVTRKNTPVYTPKVIPTELLNAIISMGGLTEALQLAVQLQEIIADGKTYEWVSAGDMVNRDRNELSAYEIWYQEYEHGEYRFSCLREDGDTVPFFSPGFEMGDMKRIDISFSADGERFTDVESTVEILLVKI